MDNGVHGGYYLQMSITKSLGKISLKYWIHNKKELLILVMSVLLGASAISSALLLIRSNKTSQYEETLSEAGNYDCLIYDTDYSTYKYFKDLPEITNAGCYYEQGNLQIPDTGMELYVAAFPDKESEKLYYAKCIRGRLPENEDEVAVDISVLGVMGLTPSFELGTKIEFEIYDEENKFVETKELAVTGYFELSNHNALGGWIRYPLSDTEEYDHMPSVILKAKNTPSKVVSFFMQSNLNGDDLAEFVNKIKQEKGFSWFWCDTSRGRANAMYSVLDPGDEFWEEHGITPDDMSIAIEEGMQRKDFFSLVLIPVFVVLIVLTVAITVFSTVTNVFIDRSRLYGILRAIGLSSINIKIYLVTEVIAISLCSALLGLLVGAGLHILMINAANVVFNLNYEYGLSANRFISAVTFNPYYVPVLLILLSVFCALLVVVFRFGQMNPVSLINCETKQKTNVNRSNNHNCESWLSTVNRKICFHSSLVMIIMTIVLATGIFGYCFFCAYSEMQSVEYSSEIEDEGEISYYDYSISAMLQDAQSDCFEENHHHFGVRQECLDQIANYELVDEYYALLRNRSTRLTFSPDQINENITAMFEDRDVHYQYNPQLDEIINSKLTEAVNTSLIKMGYDPQDAIYLIWSIGLLEKDIDQLNIVAGNVDYQKMRSGEEVILFVPEALKAICLDQFHVGDTLPLSDTIIPANVENRIFTGMDIDPQSMDYYEIVRASDGNEYPVMSYSFGTRKDINTHIGAIAVLSDLEMEKYVGSEYFSPGIICLDNTEFAAWGLPDRNYTALKIRLHDDADMYEANEFINKAIGTSQGLSVTSKLQIYDKIYKTNIKTMIIYYLIMFLLILNGMGAIIMCLYLKIKIMSDRIDCLRMIGMSKIQIFRAIITQNAYYPIIGTMAGIVPTALLQGFFIYCQKQFDSGNWKVSYLSGEVPWYAFVIKLPYYQNLFSYNFVVVLGICVLLGFILVLIGTFPQMRYISKRKLIDD